MADATCGNCKWWISRGGCLRHHSAVEANNSCAQHEPALTIQPAVQAQPPADVAGLVKPLEWFQRNQNLITADAFGMSGYFCIVRDADGWMLQFPDKRGLRKEDGFDTQVEAKAQAQRRNDEVAKSALNLDAIEAQARENAALTARAEAAEAKVGRLVEALRAMVHRAELYGGEGGIFLGNHDRENIERARAAISEIGGGNGNS